jgi:hypothetical protein
MGASSMLTVEAVEARFPTAEEGIVLVSATSSSCTSSSSSKSLRKMMLLSSDGPRTLLLRSPKSLLVNYSSHEVSGMGSSSSKDEERFSTGAFPEELPYSNTGERGRSEETSGEDSSGSSDPEGAGGGVGAPLGDGLPSLEGE